MSRIAPAPAAAMTIRFFRFFSATSSRMMSTVKEQGENRASAGVA